MDCAPFCEMKQGCKMTCAKMFLSADLLESQYLFEKYHISLTIKNVVKSGCFELPLR